MTVVAVSGDDGITLFCRGHHADDDSLLTDVQVTKTADKTHAVKLTGFFLKTPDQQHFTIVSEQGICLDFRCLQGSRCLLGGRGF